MEYEQQSAFSMSDALESINNGVSRYNLDQMFPISGNVSNTSIGSGSASGTTTFQFNEMSNWWCPSQSYFYMKLRFSAGVTTPPASTAINNNVAPGTANSQVTYCDNFICTLFTQIQSQINSQPLDTVTTPWIVDTALGYSKAHWNFIKTYSSLTRMGEGLSTRLLNVTQNGGCIDVTFRPPLSLFDVKILPPGAQFRFDFIWAASAILAFEALQKNPITIGSAAAANNQVYIDEFSFYKASIQPAPGIQLPQRGVIDLCPSVANQYPMVGTNSIQAQITLPGTTNRILVVFQDLNNIDITEPTPPTYVKDLISGIGGGYNPATSFSSIFSAQGAPSGATFTAHTAQLQNLWLSLPELGITEPRPQYNFTSNNVDMLRAYSDWAHTCQGTYSNYEGSLPYGNNDPSVGTQLVYLNSATDGGLLKPGDNNNYQQFNAWKVDVVANIFDPLNYNQTSRWGWSGSRPGPIFAFPVVRPEGKQVTQGTLYVTTIAKGGSQASVANVNATVIATYSMALAVEDVGNGLYAYKLITGV